MNFKKIIFPLIVGMFFSVGKNANAQSTTFGFTGTLQTFTVPCGVTSVTINASGAAGGGGSSNNPGFGAQIVGTFTVTAGAVLDVLAGQQGLSNNEGSGGGGSFVWNTTGNVLMVAAGGGGGGYQGGAGGNGSSTATPTLGTGPQGSVAGGSAGNGGPGGTCSSAYAGGGGGAGWISGGGTGSSCGGYVSGTGGSTPLSGGAGGLSNASNGCGSSSNGGYGGGGASSCYASGGGSGYNGGGGAQGFVGGGNGGGGGGSFNGGTSPTNTTGVETANGTVTITWTIPTPISSVTGNVVANESCNGGNNGSASETINTGNAAPFTYAWTPSAQTNATATGLTAGTYTVKVTDNCGSTATASVTITQPVALTVSTGSIVNESCNGGNTGSAKATATNGTAPYTYAWAPSGGNAATANNLTAGTYTITVHDAHGCSGTASATITQPTAVTVSTGSLVNEPCNGNNMGSATATPTGGTGAFTYAWTPSGGNAATANNLTAGTYTITVHDANGCSGTASATITQPTILTVTTGSIVNEPCNGNNMGGATATAGGGTGAYNYSWSDANTQATAAATGLTAGTYTVTATDANGCSATASATITEPAVLTVSTGSIVTILCNGGNNGSITATPSGGTAGYNYSWSDANTQATATATGLTAGTYTVTVTDANGCSATANATITQPAVLTVSAGSIVNESCNGNSDGSITADPSGGTHFYAFSWSTGGTDATISNLAIGCYTVTLTDNNGCTATTSACITQPAVLTVSTGSVVNILCKGGDNGSITATPSGGTAAYNYLWSDVNRQTAATVTGLSAGTYTVTVTDAHGCSAIATATITQPSTLTASTGSVVNILCNGGSNGSITAKPLGGTTAYTYSWSDANTQTVATATGLTAGTYTVTVTDANGCSATASASITEPTSLTVTTIINNIVCHGDNNGNLTADPSGGTRFYAFSWSNGGTTATIDNLTQGCYTITLTDNNGCTVTASACITEPAVLKIAALTALPDSICKGSCTTISVTGNGGTPTYGYSWSNGETTSSVNVCPDSTNTYKVVITDANGCTHDSTITVAVNICTGVPEVTDLESQIKFYPNPFSQSVNVNIEVSGPVTVTIFNMMGQNVGAYNMDKGLNTINTSNMAAGIYMMQVKTQNGILNKKLVKVD